MGYKSCIGCYKYLAHTEPTRFPGDLHLSEELTTKSASELAELIHSRKVSPVEVCESHLKHIEERNPSLNAIVALADDVIDRARAAGKAMMNGDAVGPLHGVPLTIKDTIDVAGLPTTSGSRLLNGSLPERDATVVSRLKEAGAIVLGKTNVAEMAAYFESDNPVFGKTDNPNDRERSAGGSSGGEAAAIAAHLSPAGIGSDLAGSIRLPAHFCGIAGLKPTIGAVPSDGHIAAASGVLSLAMSMGPMARTVADLELLFKVIADPNRSKHSPEVRDLRAAWYIDDHVTPVDAEIARAVERAAEALRDEGISVEQATPPGIEQGFGLWMDLFSEAVKKQLSDFYRGREKEAGARVAEMLARAGEADVTMEGRIAAAERQARAVVDREKWRESLLRWMKKTPIILAPVGGTCAFEHGARRVSIKDESVSVFRAFSYSETYNVFGLPAVSVPAGRSSVGLPIGVQVAGRPFEEATVLAVAKIIESALDGRQ